MKPGTISSGANRPTLAQLAWIFTRIASFTFGSGNTTTALLREEVVERRRWMGDAQFALSFALARVTPGTNVLAFSTAAGWWMRGWPGAAVTLFAIAAPSAAVVLSLSLAYDKWHVTPIGAAVVSGAMASITGVLLAGAWLLIRPHFSRRELIRTVVLATAAFVLAAVDISPLQVLAIAALAGYFWQP